MSEDKSLMDRVLFESDRTCCICRDRSRPIKIHHLDEDHSNNERGNLVVVCDPCHTLIHTSFPFSRNLNAAQVRMYDETWRAICASRLLPESGSREINEYRQEVFLELSLICHTWKNKYLTLQPKEIQKRPGKYTDIWDRLVEESVHQDSAEEFKKYLPLFESDIDNTVERLREVLACHGDVIPVDLKTLIIRTNRRLSVEQTVFKFFGPAQTDIKSRASGVLSALANLERAAKSSVSPVVFTQE